MYGKRIRLARLMDDVSKRTCIAPIDHGATMGPIEGIQDYIGTIKSIFGGGADALVLHKGLLSAVAAYPELSKGRYIMHLSASTILSYDSTYKVLVGSVEEAVKLGADGVSVHINLGVGYEAQMLKDLGNIAKACLEWGMPLLAMMYTHKVPWQIKHTMHAARLAEELGVDIVKIGYPGTIKETQELIKSVHIPIVIAGGEKMDSAETLLNIVDDALTAGASGVAIGRNIFQHKDPKFITGLVSKLIHGQTSLKECLSRLAEWEESNSDGCRKQVVKNIKREA